MISGEGSTSHVLIGQSGGFEAASVSPGPGREGDLMTLMEP